MNYKDNLEIDLLDLAKHLIKRWQILILCSFICAGIVGVIGYYKSTVTVKSESGVKVSEEDLTQFETYRENLSEADAGLVEATADHYLGYARDYADLMKYGDTSVIMKVDPNNVPKLIAAYSIDDYSVSVEKDNEMLLSTTGDGLILISDADSIIQAYSLELKTDDIISEIKSAIGLDVDNNYINELIGIDVTGSSVMEISVIGSDKEMCETIMAVLQNHIDGATAKIKEAYDYNIKPIDTYFTIGKDSNVETIQKDYNTYAYNLRYNMNYLLAIMTTEQKPYYTALVGLINNKILINPSDEEDDSIDGVKDLLAKYLDEESQVEVQTIRTFSVKYVILGLFIGAFLAALWIAIRYVMSGRLHTADDLRDAFGVSVIDEISVKGNANSRLDVAVSGIGIASTKMKVSKICVIGVARDNEANVIRDDLVKALTSKEAEKSIEICNDVLNSPADMESMADADVAVLVERRDSSKYENIAREIELCEKYGVKILGAVFVK